MKKLLVLLLIAVVGAGLAFGTNAVFFSPASNERPVIEPRGLVDQIAAGDLGAQPEPDPTPSPSPTAVPAADDGASAPQTTTAPAPVPPPAEDDGGPRDPRSPAGAGPQATSFVVQGVVDEQNPPDDPCDLEESEREQQQCENEADRAEDEADQEDDDARNR